MPDATWTKPVVAEFEAKTSQASPAVVLPNWKSKLVTPAAFAAEKSIRIRFAPLISFWPAFGSLVRPSPISPAPPFFSNSVADVVNALPERPTRRPYAYSLCAWPSRSLFRGKAEATAPHHFGEPAYQSLNP